MHVVQLTLEGRESVGGGAKLLGISTCQMKRLRRKLRERGVGGLKQGIWGNDSTRFWSFIVGYAFHVLT